MSRCTLTWRTQLLSPASLSTSSGTPWRSCSSSTVRTSFSYKPSFHLRLPQVESWYRYFWLGTVPYHIENCKIWKIKGHSGWFFWEIWIINGDTGMPFWAMTTCALFFLLGCFLHVTNYHTTVVVKLAFSSVVRYGMETGTGGLVQWGPNIVRFHMIFSNFVFDVHLYGWPLTEFFSF